MKQDIDQASDVQIYPLGKRYAIDDRVFRYARAGGTLNTDLGAKNALLQCIAFTTIHASVSAGATQVSIDVAAGDGVLNNGVIGVDELAGGYIVIYPGAENSFVRRIVRNTATTGAGEMTLTLNKPLPCALTAVMHTECIASIYSNVTSVNNGFMSIVGLPTVPATIRQYLWLQTWGPCWIAPHGGVGKNDSDMAAYFGGDAGVNQGDELNPAGTSVALTNQYAGFVLASAKDNGQGAPFIMLQISP